MSMTFDDGMAFRPPFGEFNMALRYPQRRDILGIQLDFDQLQSLTQDPVACREYYATWSPTPPSFRQRRKANRRTFREQAQTVIGIVVGAAFLALAVAAVYFFVGGMMAEMKSKEAVEPVALYTTCAEVWELHGGPIGSAETGYMPEFDPDANGIGCETPE